MILLTVSVAVAADWTTKLALAVPVRQPLVTVVVSRYVPIELEPVPDTNEALALPLTSVIAVPREWFTRFGLSASKLTLAPATGWPLRTTWAVMVTVSPRT